MTEAGADVAVVACAEDTLEEIIARIDDTGSDGVAYPLAMTDLAASWRCSNTSSWSWVPSTC